MFRSRWLTRDLQLYCSQEVTQVHQGQTVQVSAPPQSSQNFGCQSLVWKGARFSLPQEGLVDFGLHPNLLGS